MSLLKRPDRHASAGENRKRLRAIIAVAMLGNLILAVIVWYIEAPRVVLIMMGVGFVMGLLTWSAC